VQPKPLYFKWQNGVMHPVHPQAAERQYTAGELYRLVPEAERSQTSHKHYFACVMEAWKNLPEQYAERFPTSEHLRKWCLVKAGYADERSIVCESEAEAQRVGAFVKPMDDYAVVVVKENVVTVYNAKSQSVRAMGPKDFQKSKQDVLDILAEMVGVTADELGANASKAA
jgi:hypothetical protein